MKVDEWETKVKKLVETVEKQNAIIKQLTRTVEEHDVRIRTAEDIEAIKKVQRAYGFYLEHWEGQQMVDLFSNSPDVALDTGRGFYAGPEGIKQFFLRGEIPPNLLHGLMQLSGIVDVDPDGKTAKGRWYGFGPHAIPVDGIRATWSFGVYENEYIKENGKWKIKKLHYNAIFSTLYEDGWVKTPLLPASFHPQEEPKPGPSTFIRPYPYGYGFPFHYKNPVSGE